MDESRLDHPRLTAHRFFRQLRFQEFDISELSLSSYVLTLNQENPPFIALPVFPSRFFRHQSMYINKNAGINRPEDLRGKRIGIPEYQSQKTPPIPQILTGETGELTVILTQ